jgi:hypothetical protein
MRGTIVSLILILLLCTGAGLPASLEGDWVLVEQQYGKGGRNIYDDDLPLRLSVRLGSGAPVVTLHAGDHDPVPWPAWIGPSGPAEIRLEERFIDAATGTLRARFVLSSPDEPGFTYQVDEEYRLAAAGDAIAGTLTVSFFREGEPRGSFVLTSRFERVR